MGACSNCDGLSSITSEVQLERLAIYPTGKWDKLGNVADI